MSQSSSPEAETQSPRKNPPVSRYPPEYPVGKVRILDISRIYMYMYLFQN